MNYKRVILGMVGIAAVAICGCVHRVAVAARPPYRLQWALTA